MDEVETNLTDETPEEDGITKAPEAPAVQETTAAPAEPVIERPAAAPAAPQPLSASDEHTWAMLAHLSVLLNLITGFLGVVAALLIYFIYKDRSRYVAYQSLQAFVFQLIWWDGAGLAAGILWVISSILAIVVIGCLLMPLALLVSLMPLAALGYGVYAAIETNQGKDFKYWLIGDWLRETLEN